MKATVVFMVLAIVVCAMVQKSEQLFGAELPNMPKMPELPKLPKMPELPKMPQMPEFKLPKMPEFKLPQLPNLPIPQMPDLKNILPGMPQMPDLKNILPGMPNFHMSDLLSGKLFDLTHLIPKLPFEIPTGVQILCSAGLKTSESPSMPLGLPNIMNGVPRPHLNSVKDILSGNPFDLSRIVDLPFDLPFGFQILCSAGLRPTQA